MKYLMLMLMVVFWNMRALHGCTPTMYKQQFSKEILTIPVQSLSIDTAISDVNSALDLMQNNDYECVYNTDGEFEIKQFKDTLNNIQRLSFLKITGISSNFKPKVKCNRVSDGAFAPANEYTYYYIGEYKGTWQMQQRYSLLDPLFFLYIDNEQWYLGAVGKYYPCLGEALNQYNAFASSNRGDMTQILVKKKIQFEPYWVHLYMSKTGESIHNILLSLKIEQKLYLPPSKFYYEINLHEIDNDKNYVLISNHKASIGNIELFASFHIYEVHWTGSLRVRNTYWRQLVEYGYPTKDNPFAYLADYDLKAPVLKGIASVSDLLLEVNHGNSMGPDYHDGLEKYVVHAGGRFSTDRLKVPSELLRGSQFALYSRGKWLEDSLLMFSNAKCHPSGGPMKAKLETLWERMVKATPIAIGSPVPRRIKETKKTLPSDTCPPGNFRFVQIKLNHPQEHTNYHYITLVWIENKFGVVTQYDCRAYITITDFIKILSTPGI